MCVDAVWQLLGITGWVIELVEKLFKECIFVGEGTNAGRVIPDNPDGPKGERVRLAVTTLSDQ